MSPQQTSDTEEGGTEVDCAGADESARSNPSGRRDGWFEVKSKGGHRQFKHAEKPGRVTISGKLGDDLAPGTFDSILKQAGLKK